MGVSTQIVKVVGNTIEFDKSSKKVNRELDTLVTKANVAIQKTRQARAESAGIGGRTRGPFEIKRNKVGVGVFELGTNGFELDKGAMRGAFGSAASAAVGTHLVAGGLRSFARARDMVNEVRAKGGTNSEVARAAGGVVARNVGETVASLTGVRSLVEGMLQASGMSQQEAAGELQKFMDKLTLTREELERRADELKESKDKMLAEIDAKFADAMGQVSQTLPKTFRLRSRGDVTRYRRELAYSKTNSGFSNREISEFERKAARSKADFAAKFQNEGR